ncbi:MAG: DUF4292 domain-containing protein [Proteobacteria bacterium]|nr:DUF4292 domain-containing protein [Pseudomonadota bacterium]
MTGFMRKALFLILIVSLAACAKPKRTIPPAQPVPAIAKLLERLEPEKSKVFSLEGRMSIKINSPSGKNSSTQLILLQRPSSIRLDAVTPFGQPVLTLSTNGETMDIYYHSKKRFFSGDARSRSLSAIFPVSLSIKDLTLILSGQIPLIEFDKNSLRAEIEDGRYLLTMNRDGIREELYFDMETLDLVEGIIYGPGGETVLAVSMGKYKTFDNIRLPTKIKTSLPLENYKMETNYSEISPNSIFPGELFALQPPEGVEIENLDSLNF